MKELPKNILPRKSATMCPECGHDEVLTSVLGTARREGKHLIIELGGWVDESRCLECQNRNYEFDLPEILLRISQPSGDRSDGQTAPCTVELIVPGYELEDEDEGIGHEDVDELDQEVFSGRTLSPYSHGDLRRMWDEFVAQLFEKLEVNTYNNDFTHTRAILQEMNEELNAPKWRQIDIEETLAHMQKLGAFCDRKIILNVHFEF